MYLLPRFSRCIIYSFFPWDLLVPFSHNHETIEFHSSTLFSGFLEYFLFSESLINVTGLFYLGGCVDRMCFHFSASLEESYSHKWFSS